MFNQLMKAQPMPTPNLTVMNLYDFDGVIASPLEEALFQLPSGPHDSAFVRKVSDRFDLDLSNESPLSQRYICVQAVLWDACIDIQPGPMFEKITGPYHILTARCDRFAVARMHEFVTDNLVVKPIKTMHLDHLPKGRMIEVLLERHPDVQFRYWDDNHGHCTSANMLRSPRLEVFPVDSGIEPYYTEAESYFRNTILELAL